MNLLRNNLRLIIGLILIIGLYALLYKIYIPRVNAFGCFDDCFNFLGGYFLNQGKEIFTDFFYNHQPGMAYVSAFIQWLTKPDSIPELVLRHRQFIFGICLLSTLVLFLRFKTPIILTTLLYEPFKFYVFGDRFLAESILGYLLIYMVGVFIQAYSGKFKKYDLVVFPLLSSFIIFLREPFIPVSLLLMGAYLVLLIRTKRNFIPTLLFFIAPLTLHLTYNFADYYLNLVTVNKLVIAPQATGITPFVDIMRSAFYPIYLILAPSHFSFIRVILAFYSLVFIGLFTFFSLRQKKVSLTLLILFTLFLINLRPVGPNQAFFEAFHIAPWFLLICFLVSYFLASLIGFSKKYGLVILSVIVIFVVYNLTNNQYFAHDKIDTSGEFFTNYSHVMDIGTTVRNLASNGDTLFVDGYDDLIIWEAKLDTSYKYSWYTSYMPKVDLYKLERDNMLLKSPPDFYYGTCMSVLKKQTDTVSLFLSNNFVQLSPKNESSCILISKNKMNSLTPDKIEKLRGTKYENFKIQDILR